MKRFRQFLEDFYHSSSSPIGKVGDRPMWFSNTKKHAKGWSEKTADENDGKVVDYKADITGNIADLDKVKLDGHSKKEIEDYQKDMADYPSKTKVHTHPITKSLKKAGYDGVKHDDFDPTTLQKTKDGYGHKFSGHSTLVFHPNKNVKLKKNG